MNILHVIPSFAPAWRYGGPIVASLVLTTALAKRGHYVKVFTTNKDGSSVLPVQPGKPLNMEGIEVTYFPVQFPKWYYFSFKLSNALKQELPKFDIVHIHSVYLWPTTIASYWCRKMKIPYIIRPAGLLDSININKDYESFIGSYISKIKKNGYIKLFGKYDLHGAKGIQYTSQYEMDSSIKLEINNKGKVIPIGVDLPKSSATYGNRTGSNVEPGSKTLLVVARLDPIKGIDRLIAVISNLYQLRKDFKLIIGGSGEASYERKLQEMIKRNGLSDVVHMIGSVNPTEKNIIFQKSDLFILLSHHENFGVAVAEAMSMNLPVVISNNVGIHDYVKDYGAGLVFGKDNPELIAHQISKLLDNPNLMNQMGKNGRDLCENEFAWDKIAFETEKYYEELISNESN